MALSSRQGTTGLSLQVDKVLLIAFSLLSYVARSRMIGLENGDRLASTQVPYPAHER